MDVEAAGFGCGIQIGVFAGAAFTLCGLGACATYVALCDPPFYELLALFDALRIGQARERDIVRTQLEERLK